MKNDDIQSSESRVAGSFRSAVKWSVVMNLGRQVANLIITFLLAAILGPTAFGLVAIAMIYVAFVQLLMQQGIRAALVQRPDLGDHHLTSGFWVVMLSGAVLTVISLGASEFWADFNDQPQLGSIVRALTPLVLLRGLLVVPDAILTRRLAFRSLAIRTNVSVLGGGIAGVIAAVAGAGVWSLVIQQLTTAVLEVVIVWAAVDWRPKASLSRSAVGDLFGFSWRSAVASFGSFVNERADAFAIALFLGPTAVGLYRFAARIVDTVLQSIVGSLRAVALPELSRLQNDSDAVRSRSLMLRRVASAATLVPLAALAAAAPGLIQLVGDDWKPATAAIAILAVAGFGRVLGQLTGPLLQALGHPGRLALLTWLAAILSAASLLAASAALQGQSIDEQVTGLALVTATLWSGIFLVLSTIATAHAIRVPVSELMRCLMPATAAGIVGYGAGRAIDLFAGNLDIPLLRVAITGGGAFAAAAVVAVAVEPEIRNRLRHYRHEMSGPSAV